MSNFSYPNNAQVRGDFLYVRDSSGNILSGHRVDDGDNITVLDVSYSKQLALVEYPTSSGIGKGYVTNATDLIYYYNEYGWHNGSTKEIVYDENGKSIGSISPWETATLLYQKSNGMYQVVYDTSKGKNTKSGFVKYSGHTSSDDPKPSTFSFPNNAQVKGDFLYVRDSDGNILSGHRVDDGDCITVIDVGYTKQLALVQYPTDNGTLEGYVTNATDIIKYFNTDEWHNGSTKEIVYDENGTKIGSLSPYESATPLYRKNGMTAVVYNTSKGKNTKSGFVRYSGSGVYNPPSKSNTPPESTGTPGNMIVSDALVKFIASYEGYFATAYRGVDYQNLTIGYGHVIMPGEHFTSLTQQEALNLLKSDLKSYENSVNREFGSILNQNQFDSLVSFSYNLGAYVWPKANLTKDIKASASNDVLKRDFVAWDHCNGKEILGLKRRRLDEWEMFVNADYIRSNS